MTSAKTHDFYRLTFTSYDGHTFQHPNSVKTLGEIKQAWNFNHPYTLKHADGRLVIEQVPQGHRHGEKQIWELAL